MPTPLTTSLRNLSIRQIPTPAPLYIATQSKKRDSKLVDLAATISTPTHQWWGGARSMASGRRQDDCGYWRSWPGGGSRQYRPRGPLWHFNRPPVGSLAARIGNPPGLRRPKLNTGAGTEMSKGCKSGWSRTGAEGCSSTLSWTALNPSLWH